MSQIYIGDSYTNPTIYLFFLFFRLVILLQRRKKYKSRTILGYKTLAEGIIRMDAVLQKSMDMIIELTASGKNGRPGTVVACLRAERVSSIPVDHDNKNNNSVLLAGESSSQSKQAKQCCRPLHSARPIARSQATYCQIHKPHIMIIVGPNVENYSVNDVWPSRVGQLMEEHV